jgi:hypothetical protein
MKAIPKWILQAKGAFERVRSAFRKLPQLIPHSLSRRRRPQLQLCESLALGERRMLSLVAFEERKFLVGGAGSSLALLAEVSEQSAGRRPENEHGPTWKFIGGELRRSEPDAGLGVL